MQFRLNTTDNTKEILYRLGPAHAFTAIDVGLVETPADPQELFFWITAKLKEHGAVPEDTVFHLNLN